MHKCLTQTNFSWGKKYQGKVRDTYEIDDQLILVTTDRLSAFDRVLAAVPHKGQVLNLISAWWFEQTKNIIPNHVISIPDVNVTIAKKCRVFPIEFVVRAYATGSTSTSLWTQYQNGVRNYCGHVLPEGLVKNEALFEPILTPTTKDKLHDCPISAAEIIKNNLMSKNHFEKASTLALQLFKFGQKIAAKRGYILVDTKYEIGLDEADNLILLDELHTPDSSRYWLFDTYEKKMSRQEEPDSLDKEHIRLWFKEHCDPYRDEFLPQAPQSLIEAVAKKYITLYESLTEKKFVAYQGPDSVAMRIEKNLHEYFGQSLLV